jgi:predicted ATP-dependent endonuclease of OLD family
MRYKSFRIQNYKGVRDTTIQIPAGSSNAVTLIGLNESGKTTLLEAIYSFSPDAESEPLFVDTALLPDESARIPRDKLFSFSDTISVTAVVEFLPGEKDRLVKRINSAIGGQIDPTSIADSFEIEDWQKFVNSTQLEKNVTWDQTNYRIKTGRQQKWRPQSNEEWGSIWRIFKSALPAIAYFPTFLSQIPNRIYLRGHEDDKTNTFYRTIFQDILYQIGPDYTIKSQILDRLDQKETGGLLSQAIAAFWGSPRRGMVQQLIDKAGAVLSTVITDRWNDIFKSRPAGREIVINFGLEENSEDDAVDPYIEFAIRDGTNRFNIADRSLGFRWFFCFLLFTQFRAKRHGGSGTLFLFDEPASNLHAKAQEKLLESFRDISQAPNRLIYSTHSPYMIEPIWLDDAYVVENTLISEELQEIGQMSVVEQSDIVALRYKSYVDRYPDRLNHFQPVLDRLEVKPSIGEISERTLLVEGKSDYAILRGLFEGRRPPFKIVPAHGATTLGALIGLLRGWGWKFVVLLDSDKKGAEAANRYQEDFALTDELLDLRTITGATEIEGLLTDSDRSKISTALAISGKLTKKQIYSFFVARAGEIRKFQFDAAKGSAITQLSKSVAKLLS